MIELQKLHSALQELQRTLTEISNHLRLERSAIVELNTAAMEIHSKCLLELFPSIDPLNKNLATAVKSLAKSLFLGDEDRIFELSTHIPKPDRERILTMQNGVKLCAESINNDLAINHALLVDSQKFTTNSLQIFTNALKQTSNATYGQQGRFVETVEQPHIICKEI